MTKKYINPAHHTITMYNTPITGPFQNSSSRLRSIRFVIIQIKQDHEDLKQLMEKCENSIDEIFLAEEIFQKISMIRAGLVSLNETSSRDIEGVTAGELIDIEKTLEIVEWKLKCVYPRYNSKT